MTSKRAARCDGISEYGIFFHIILPLVRPAIATVGVFTMVPIWNDLWFPLILAPSPETATITLGVQQFIGQYVTDWNSVLSSLTMGHCAGSDHLSDFLAPADPRHHLRRC